MLVCHCNGVSDRAIRKVVREGMVTVADVGRACGAGTCCGGCAQAVEEVIQVEAAAHHGTSPAPSNASGRAEV